MFLQEKKLNLLYFSISSPRPLRFTAVPSWALLHNTGDDYKKKLQDLSYLRKMLQCNVVLMNMENNSNLFLERKNSSALSARDLLVQNIFWQLPTHSLAL